MKPRRSSFTFELLPAAFAERLSKIVEDASSGYSQGSDLVNGPFWTRGEMTAACK
jgi:hypothetical protein